MGERIGQTRAESQSYSSLPKLVTDPLLLAKQSPAPTFRCIERNQGKRKKQKPCKAWATCLLAFFVLSGCAGESNVERALDDQILHFGLGAEPQSIDPHLANSVSAHNILTALLEGLVSENPKTLKPTPGVAEKWDISEDGTVYVFYFRKNAKWSNGDSVTAHDFVYSYKRILDPNLGSQYASMLHILKNAKVFGEGKKTWGEAKVGVRALDDLTLELTLENPVPYFLEQLNHFTWFPVHPPTIKKFGARTTRGTKWTRTGNYVGNGPFILTEHHVNSVIMVERNPKYWDAANVRLNGIRFYPIESVDTEERAFHSGFLHLTQTVSADRIDSFKKDKPNLIHFEPYLGTYFYRFNVDKPPFDDIRVRKAMNLAIDRESLVKNVTKGGQQPAVSFTPTDTGGFIAKPSFKYDVGEAKRLIKDYLAEKGLEKLPPIELKYNTSEGHKKLAVAMQGMWKKHLGIEIKLLNMEWKVFLATTSKRDFVLARGGWIGDYVDANTFLHMWRTNDGH
ncbi:MAG: peptide ABC transporter substrate-binding protein, partial [Opitutales bacterium]